MTPPLVRRRSQMKYAIILISMCYTVATSPAREPAASQNPVWIDVRTPAEYETGHLPGAHNIDFDQIATQITEIAKAKETPIIVYCRSGRRSALAKQTLEQLGYLNVVNAGGIDEVLRKNNVQAVTGPDCITGEC